MCYETNVLFTWCHHTEHFLRRCPKAPCSGWKGHFKSQPGLCLRCSAGPGVVALATAAWRTGAGMPMCVSATEGTSEAALRSQPPLRITEHDACPGIRKREDIGERRARFEKEERATGPYSSLNMRRANGGPRGGDARRAGGARRHYEQQTKLKVSRQLNSCPNPLVTFPWSERSMCAGIMWTLFANPSDG